jgi:stearoyl-CoA desaturase (delta-9 desaturase)
VAIGAPLAGVIAAPFYVWGWGFRWTDLGLLVGMYVLTALGITVGFHRLFVHRSFETYVSYWVIRTLAALGLAWNVKVPTAEAQANERRLS